jgi:DNA helicase-2/ATP-dependent DNA helicase PcrA
MQDDILAGLNPAQRDAVTAIKGPVLVLAGPGSGKTRVLAHRVAYLLRVAGVHPRAILAVTFTNKAAGEMRDRINRLLGESVPTSTGWKGLTIGTFHSICARILRAEAGPAGLNPNYVIYDDGEQLTAIKQALRDLKLDEKMYRPEALRGAISKAKNELVKPEAFDASTYWAEIARRVYTRYQEIMAANGALDFDDLLTRTTWLFQEQPEVLKRYQERYQYLLVDEFQDTNTAQYEMVHMLVQKHRTKISQFLPSAVRTTATCCASARIFRRQR